jgi:Uncharacterized protein conserved in bacteria
MPSFDIVSKTEIAEVDNALNGIGREIGTRFDFKGFHCSIERKDNLLTILADNQTKLEQMHELLKVYFTRRNIDPRALDFKTPQKASGDTLRQEVVVRQGIDQAVAKRLVKEIKDSKIKVQASIQGDELRVSGKKRDELQEVIALCRKLDVELPLQFVNFRD